MSTDKPRIGDVYFLDPRKYPGYTRTSPIVCRKVSKAQTTEPGKDYPVFYWMISDNGRIYYPVSILKKSNDYRHLNNVAGVKTIERRPEK